MKRVYLDKEPLGHYTPGMISNGHLYISGQTSADPVTGKPAKGGIQGETLMALQKMEAVLQASELTKEAVVMCRVYITSSELWGEVNEAYAKFFGEHKPARAIIPIKELNHGCLIELEAVAEL
ncbi:RidA family protein [Lysinibacillus parviboronicapiens]|uniref:RidA family protein n=1 Tax=Lysinibacillus parviboronicapiens TaxID=436516 RepID=UPI000D345F1B|nr:RidA family protein [Lysinibacillus parviboronicapiens]